MDEQTKQELARLSAVVWALKAEVFALRLGLAAAAESFPDKAALAAAFHAHAERAIADTLTRDYPEEMRLRIEQALESTRQYLNGIAQEQNQRKGD